MNNQTASAVPFAFSKQELVALVGWLIRLRWLPTAILLVFPWFALFYDNLALAPLPLFLGGITLLLGNTLFLIDYRNRVIAGKTRGEGTGWTRIRTILWPQIVLDWAVAGIVLHWTGGIANPILFLLVLHMALSSIFLTPKQCLTMAVSSFVLVALFGQAYNLEVLAWHPIGVGQTKPEGLMILVITACFGLAATALVCFSTFLGRRIPQKSRLVLRLSQNLEKANSQLKALNSLAQETSSILEYDHLLSTLTTRVAKSLDLKACILQLFTKEKDRLDFAVGHGMTETSAFRYSHLARTPLMQKALDGNSVNIEIMHLSVDPWVKTLSTEGWSSLAGAPIQGKKGVIGIIWVANDEALSLNSDDTIFLSSAGRQAGIAIENAMAWADLKELDRKKTEFVNKVTHELRSPVVVTLSLLNLITEGFTGEVPAKQQDMLKRAERRVKSLETLINDLLVMAQARSAPVATQANERTDLAHVVRDVVEHYRVVATGKKQQIDLQIDSGANYSLLAGEGAVNSIVDNLVSNAVKYTPETGRIGVQLSIKDGELILAVKDTGIGIPADSIPRIGQEFFRAPNARRQEAVGTGLGMAITSRLVAGLNGRMDIASEEGKGSQFSLRFAAG